MEATRRNKWLLLVSSLGVLVLLVMAAIDENVLAEWRQIQRGVRTDEGPLSVQLRQVVNPALGVTDRCVSCHVSMAPGEQNVTAAGSAPHPAIVHDPSDYGCTICHGGQGRATRKEDAHGTIEFWPAPMLPVRMSEAGCGTCHIAIGVPRRELFDAAKAAFERLDCAACHRVDGRGGTLRPDGGGMEGPDLSRVGITDYDHNWYTRHQEHAATARNGPWRSSFGAVADVDRPLIDTFLSTRVGAPELVAAKSTFHTSGCLGCHKVNGVGGDEGPDLTREGEKDPGRADFSAVPGERTLANWFDEHVRAPAAVVPGSLMPPAVSIADADVDALTLYTLSLRRRDVPGAYLPRDRMRVARFGEREFTSDGATLFGAFCGGCHGRQGEGRRVTGALFPSVANPDFLSLAPDALVVETILRGRPGRRMRAWGDGSTGLNADDAKAILLHLRTVSATAPPVDARPPRWVAGDRAEGERLFAAACSGCHGPKGEGGDGPALNNGVLQQFATDTYFVETIARGRRGTDMRGFTEPSTAFRALSRPEIEDIVTFIRSWGGKP